MDTDKRGGHGILESPQARAVVMVTSLWKLGGDIKGKGPQELVEEQTAGDLSPGMLVGTAHVHLASVPCLPIKIKEIDFLLFASED